MSRPVAEQLVEMLKAAGIRQIYGVSLDLERRFRLKFMEIGTDKDHVHFLVQSVPTCSVTELVTLIKRITAQEIFRLPSCEETVVG